MKQLTVLGSTGSIGRQTLDVAEKLGFGITALTAGGNAALLEAQVRRFRPAFAALADEDAAKALRLALADTPTKVLAGAQGVAECAAMRADVTLNALVGVAGLPPTLAALEAGNTLALANKESLVAGGALVTQLAAAKKTSILPVDSEHSAVFQALQGCPDLTALRRVILTASGGAFYGRSRAEMAQVTAEEALRHPNWNMGAKITIDCATMMNKGFEVIEAVWLFGLPEDRVDVVIHRQSVVHSMIEYMDGAVLAQLGAADMRLPIQYALTYPRRLPCPAARLELEKWGSLTFAPPDGAAFPALALCRAAIRRGGLVPAALNGANEAANALFRQGKLPFLAITELVAGAIENAPQGAADTLAAINAADQGAREYVNAHTYTI
ncbi:MAG: 1-deoxy-D-xylulose-5-phosphate reductoisomerase [Oscillospiraceae bacterium]|jgi:1-deoxy-D-xylulose-5-phosphate reductoisomerase|nr:1-deoxy-D-xylulose-5-phosphate reductoisomerase [Oscillospiraceae bacterium]